jgi:hypothetical protein
LEELLLLVRVEMVVIAANGVLVETNLVVGLQDTIFKVEALSLGRLLEMSLGKPDN